MFFTREDILKIQQALLKLSIKDSELPSAEPVTYNDTLSIVQDGKNKQIKIEDFFNQISLWKREDFINITDKYDEHYISLLEAINLVPTLQRKNGLVITFQNVEGNWEIYQFRGNITEFFNKEKWFDLYDYRNYIIQSIVPDEEDLTASTPDKNENSLVSLKDRVYDPTSFSGKGYKILRKNIQSVNIASTKINITEVPSTDGTLSFTINGKETQITVSASTDNTTALVAQKVASALQASMTEYDVLIDDSLITITRKSNDSVIPSTFSASTTGVVCTITDSTKREFLNILTQNMINKPNTIYEIRYDFDLNGGTIDIPENCTLKFEGGSLSNGKIVGNDTKLQYRATIFTNIIIAGTWLVGEIKSSIFSDITSTNKLQQLFNLCNNKIFNRILIEEDNYNCSLSSTVGDISGTGLTISGDNIEVILNGNITLASNGYPDYNVLIITDSNNITIKGTGSIVGDKESHDYTKHSEDDYKTHEWGRIISIRKSKGVFIEGITLNNSTGDCLNIGDSTLSDGISENIILKNLTLTDCRRNGITIATCNNVFIDGLKIKNVHGTNPQAGIDIEPNTGGVVYNVFINNSFFENCGSAIEAWNANTDVYNNIHIKNINVNNCGQSIFDASAGSSQSKQKSIFGLGNAKNIEVDNICISDSNWDGSVLSFFKTNNVRVTNVTINGCEYDGSVLKLQSVKDSLVSNMTINENSKGIFINTISNGICKIENSVLKFLNIVGKGNVDTLNNVLFENNDIDGQMWAIMNNCVFNNNTINNTVVNADNKNYQITTLGQVAFTDSYGWRFWSNCKFLNNAINIPLYITCYNTLFTNNKMSSIILENASGGQINDNLKFINNTIFGNLVLQHIKDSIFSNNTININKDTSELIYLDLYTNVILKNNIINIGKSLVTRYISNGTHTLPDLTNSLYVIGNKIKGRFRKHLDLYQNIDLVSIENLPFNLKSRPNLLKYQEDLNANDNSLIGYMYFDSSLESPRPVYWTGTKWVDAAGADV